MQATGIAVGIDIGAVSVKLAAVLPPHLADAVRGRNGTSGLRLLKLPHTDSALAVAPVRRTRGRPLEALTDVFDAFVRQVGQVAIGAVAVTGSAERDFVRSIGGRRINGFQALARAVDALCPEVRTVFEIGGESSKFLRLTALPDTGRLTIADYGANGDCAAGTGSFLDQQCGRLKFAIEDVGAIVAETHRAAQIAGRCSVFAKSDMIHSQQKGFTPSEVLRGLCQAVAANYRTAVVKGRKVEPPIAAVGGVAANGAVVRALADVFDLRPGPLYVPAAAESYGAIGAALAALEHAETGAAAAQTHTELRAALVRARDREREPLPTLPPLSMERVVVLRDRIRPNALPAGDDPIECYLGIDIGSVGTKLVVIDEAGELVHSIFTRTEGRPLEVVSRCLGEIDAILGKRLIVRGVGTTGSGREFIGELVGADAIHDEITAHKTGATYVGDRLLGRRPDTIFEIGGQDSKYIRLQPDEASGDAIVVDFTMNEACAAGTGSFLEERAEELGVSIKGEFADLALAAQAPVRLGERCTVFMERDVNACLQRGARRDDLIAGLAYSVAHNYINRVVRGRPVGDTVFFQGGTAHNDAVAAAFSVICNKTVIIPPHNAVLGAWGAALLARERMTESGRATRFRGFNIEAVPYGLREISCKACGNRCSVQEFTVAGQKTYWGDKCSERFRKQARSERRAVIADLIAKRRDLLAADDAGDPPAPRAVIGLPLGMYAWDLLPLWRQFFRGCGFGVVSTGETDRSIVQRGLDAVVAEPCFPIIAAHGHAAALLQQGIDALFVPNVVSAETQFMSNESYVCPWGATLPFVLRQSPVMRAWRGRLLCPTIRLRDGAGAVGAALIAAACELGVPKRSAERAFHAAWDALVDFRRAYQRAGAEALDLLARSGDPGVVLVGRPYNLHDGGVSLSVGRKLRDLYGINVIPLDALSLADIDVTDVNDNMFWEYGRRILAAGKLVKSRPNLHIIYITNFKCGPDSFIKSFLRDASGKPFLTLQFDGHSNDAGMMTRCEAYLDSKGILRWWRRPGRSAPPPTWTGDGFTSRRCPVPAPG